MPETLLLLPGILCDAELWRAPIAALADVAHCVVPDLPGDSIDAMARHVLNQAPQRFALAGLSMGGYVALSMLRQDAGRVQRLCLANTSARADTAVQGQARQAMIAQTRAGGFAQLLHRLLPLLTHPDRRDDQALQMRLDAMMRRVGPETFVRQQTATAGRVDSRPALAHITVPTCIIAGGADRVTPAEHAAEMAGCIRGASLHVLEPCAHLTPMEAPGRVGDVMRVWLQLT